MLLLLGFLGSLSTTQAALAQIDPGPGNGGVTSPPQMVCLGHSLQQMRDTFLVPHFIARHTVTALRFTHVINANGSDVYLGSIQISGTPVPLAIDPQPSLPTNAEARWGYVHLDNSAPPDPLLDTFVMAITPINSNRTPGPTNQNTIIGSRAELDLLVQVCQWMEPGQTPDLLLSVYQWLAADNTRIDDLRTWRNKNRVVLQLTGRQLNPNGDISIWRSEISWEPLPNGDFQGLEVQP
ncbi:MAG: hypothetical protein AAEJ04_06085 [Planctomycetota bacterium]